MYTAEMARKDSVENPNRLDILIAQAVKEANYKGFKSTTIRIYNDDSYLHTIREELEKRGFTVLHVPYIGLKGDVNFSW